MNLGLRPFSFEFLYEAPKLLKRDLLYFDQIQLCSTGAKVIFPVLQRIDPDYYEKIKRELDFLRSHGLVCDFNLSSLLQFIEQSFQSEPPNARDRTDLNLITTTFEAASSAFNGRQLQNELKKKTPLENQNALFHDIDQLESEVTRISSALLNRFAARDEATAILQNNLPVDLPNFETAKVLEVVLNKLPIPSAEVEWTQIVEYRADPDSSAKFLALRVWMQDIAKGNYTKTEIEERIDHLINEYERHLSYHKLKYERSTRHILLNAPLEILENLLKINWSNAGKKRFSLEEKKFDLMQAHLTAPGRELAYISKANDLF